MNTILHPNIKPPRQSGNLADLLEVEQEIHERAQKQTQALYRYVSRGGFRWTHALVQEYESIWRNARLAKAYLYYPNNRRFSTV